MWQDGDTEVSLGLAEELDPGRLPSFDAMLQTPNRAVAVSTIEGDIVLETRVPDERTRVRIWVNDPSEPDEVIIGLE